MKATRYAPVLLGLLLPQALRAQISTDTCCGPLRRTTLPARAAPHGTWRITGSLGAAAQYRREVDDNKLFKSTGPAGTIAADYYLRRRFGVGVQVGGLGFNLRPTYTQFYDRVVALDGPPPSPVQLQPLSNMASFQLLAGPVLALAVGRQLTVHAAVRGGGFYNDAPTGDFYRLDTNQLVYRIATSDRRVQVGGLGSLALYYPLTEQVQLGLGAAVFISPITYTVDNLQGQTHAFRQPLTGYSAFASVAVDLRPRPSQRALPLVLPTCYAPILPTTEPAVYDVAQGDAPLFTWKSGAPVYATDEEFTFRLFSLPDNKVLLERITTTPQLSWPAGQKLPDAPTQCYYTIQASRRDQAGQRCLSPVTTGLVRFVKK